MTEESECTFKVTSVSTHPRGHKEVILTPVTSKTVTDTVFGACTPKGQIRLAINGVEKDNAKPFRKGRKFVIKFTPV